MLIKPYEWLLLKIKHFILGLDSLFRLTRSGTCKLRVDIGDWTNNFAFAEYGFVIT